MLYLIATPIGNLADMTFRAIDTLKSCDYCLCEDTRHSQHLFDHYDIKIPRKSFHKFNEAQREDSVLQDLKDGLTIALVSDAGMPAICDPGARLVEACHREGVEVTVIPGPSAFIGALALTGWQREQFQFVGFIPKTEGLAKKFLEKMANYPGISIAYETAQRLIKTLTILNVMESSRQIAVVRELTKRYEECKRGSVQELLTHYSATPPRGEIVLLIDEAPVKEIVYNEEELASLVKTLIDTEELSLSEAVRRVAEKTNYPRRKLYQLVHLALTAEDC